MYFALWVKLAIVYGKKVLLSLYLTKHHALKTYEGNGRSSPPILNLRHQMQVSCRFHSQAAYQKERPINNHEQAGN